MYARVVACKERLHNLCIYEWVGGGRIGMEACVGKMVLLMFGILPAFKYGVQNYLGQFSSSLLCGVIEPIHMYGDCSSYFIYNFRHASDALRSFALALIGTLV